MSHKNKKSLIKQVEEALTAKMAIGESRRAGKQDGTAPGKIYSWGTFQQYMACGARFAKWAKAAGCSTLPQAREQVGPYLRDMITRGLSPYTVKSTAAALGKLYGCPSSDFGVVIPDRSRAAITRSRGAAARDRGFAPDRNRVLVAVAECSGLRRSELACLTGDRLRDLGGGRYGILVDRGSKGGRIRTAPLVGPPEDVAVVVSAMRAAGAGHVFRRINSHADIHAMRARYAARVYADAVSRRGEGSYTSGAGKRSEGRSGGHERGRYCCRKDRAGVWYDREAMREASRALGHSRIDVIAGHYLHTL